VPQALDALSGGRFADLDPQRRDAVAARLRETGGGALTYLTRIILQCYYRTIGSCGRSAWNRGRPFLKALKWAKATGPCWIQYVRARYSIATQMAATALEAWDERWATPEGRADWLVPRR